MDFWNDPYLDLQGRTTRRPAGVGVGTEPEGTVPVEQEPTGGYESGLQTSECLIWGAHPPDGLWKPLPYSPAPLVAGSEITDLIHKAFDFG